MFAIVLYLLRLAAIPLDSVVVHEYSLKTDKGENVLHHHFDRRRLADSTVNRLALKFNVSGEQFAFVFQRSYPIFERGCTMKIAGNVRIRRITLASLPYPCVTYLLYK